MSKLTVKQAKEMGVVFVEGDACRHFKRGLFAGSWWHDSKEGNPYWDYSMLTEFAWRAHGSNLMPCDGDLPVEVMISSTNQKGIKVKAKASSFVWDSNKKSFNIATVDKWRPELEEMQKMNTDKMETTAKEDEEWALKDAELNQVDTSNQQYTSLADFGKRADAGIDIDSVRRERDTLKERCSDLELQIDNLERVVKEKSTYSSGQDGTINALKERLRLKELECVELSKELHDYREKEANDEITEMLQCFCDCHGEVVPEAVDYVREYLAECGYVKRSE